MSMRSIKFKIARTFCWLDSDATAKDSLSLSGRRPEFELDRLLPFAFLHLGCFFVFLTGTSNVALAIAALLYFVRMFAITAFYHRYFSHRSFKTSRIMQFLFAVIGLSAVQRGPLWWAAHHRRHHRESDTENDIHSPVARSFWWAHLGWLTSSQNMPTDYDAVQDFSKFPELRFLNRFDWLVPSLLFIFLYGLGEYLSKNFPSLETSGPQLLVWGFFISTVVLFHATSSINSLNHIFGSRRYNTDDNSKNNFILALITLGEGWHNNHHQYSHCVRQGFYWWEIDLTYYGLRVLSSLGLIYALKPVPLPAYRTLEASELASADLAPCRADVGGEQL
ncbi:MAG: acyl-CoA desaturase [Candidatus Obscuribacterales bacterium]|nr:acyl-CoA desaturase [Candidatus Obscuribacterales bacterium]